MLALSSVALLSMTCRKCNRAAKSDYTRECVSSVKSFEKMSLGLSYRQAGWPLNKAWDPRAGKFWKFEIRRLNDRNQVEDVFWSACVRDGVYWPLSIRQSVEP
jgi:hypothetical protein